MARDPELIEKRNSTIREEFEKLTNVREYGARKYTNDYCLARLSNNFFLSKRSVERVIFCQD